MLSTLALVPLLLAVQAPAPSTPPHVADAIVDLRTSAGAALVGGTWRVAQAQVIEVEHRDPGPDRKASGAPNRTRDLALKAGARDLDDSGWETVAPEALEERRATGRLSFQWYRLRLTIPERVGSLATTGTTVVFEIVVDDYAEVWVDGELPQVLGTRGGQLAAGWNAPNRVVVGRDVRPGQQIQLAVFAANAPLSEPPANFIWVRSATLDFFRPGRLDTAEPVALEVERVDPALDAILGPAPRLERVAKGFSFTEGPVWVSDARAGGYLLFSDPNENVIHRFAPGLVDGALSVYRTKSGYTGVDVAEYGQPGSNGLALDAEGRLLICEHGNRRVTRLEKNGTLTVLADRYPAGPGGKRLNSPNDLVVRSDGALYFTDPPFGLPQFHADPRRELDVTGVFCLVGGELKLVGTELSGPNGVAFSPDERHLYVTNWDERKKVVMRYESLADGTLANGRVFFDMTAAPGAEALDGVKVDRAGNLFVSGPGGTWVIDANGKHLGTLVGPELAANFAWGPDERTLFWTARSGLYRLTLAGTAVTLGRKP
ncbi:MAG TPA: SMP-30/gluconolactonase/LRE family protein [Planctomycetota bacterium]